MTESIQAMQTLHKNLVAFIDELIDMFPNEGDFVILRIMVKDRVPITDLVPHLSFYLLPEKDAVKLAIKNALAGNPGLFNERINDMFAQFGGLTTTNYKKLFDDMDNENKIVIWKWLHLFIHLLEKCQK
jgi:hypothetical protein